MADGHFSYITKLKEKNFITTLNLGTTASCNVSSWGNAVKLFPKLNQNKTKFTGSHGGEPRVFIIEL